MLGKHQTCKCKNKAASQRTNLNKGKAKFAESLNNYITLRDAIEHQFVGRSAIVATGQKKRFQIA